MDGAPLVFVDQVTLNLVRNDEVLKSFTIESQRNDLPDLVKTLVTQFTAAARQ